MAEIQKFDNLLEVESAFYESAREELLLKYPNRVLLIHGDSVQGDYETVAEAISEGVRKFGSDPFLVRRAGEDEPVLSAPALTLGMRDVLPPAASTARSRQCRAGVAYASAVRTRAFGPCAPFLHEIVGRSWGILAPSRRKSVTFSG